LDLPVRIIVWCQYFDLSNVRSLFASSMMPPPLPRQQPQQQEQTFSLSIL
jgi:hypothetical protein